MVKKVEESSTESWKVVKPAQLNGKGTLFGGELMGWLDEVSGIVALRHSEGMVSTVAVEGFTFTVPIHNNDCLMMRGRIVYVGRTSMDVLVETFVDDLHGNRKKVSQGYYIYVALDKNGKPREVPGICIETEEQKRDWESAKRRREGRGQYCKH
ncbi:acyl-CoA thioesterase [Anaeromicropila populeti]|uniref:Acyl-CoA hydrolase n=1 Tax=Anaeromicropila populeti TaxID=37658 RepID=A0A1I6LUB4_9FIRM|nr:acyl-CoA thioesterase [Anaeromicropila populeti]SFS07061.1 Acyl-CoA hydrolase [Anaeromicropila populeti]